MKHRLPLLPAWMAIILAHLIPVYGAIEGKLFFFQVLYLYWTESVLLIFFDAIRIALARGSQVEGGLLLQKVPQAPETPMPVSALQKPGIILRFILVRMGLLLFYLVFIVVFIALQVTGRDQMKAVLDTVIFRNVFFNTALGCFLISMTVQLLAGFILNGKYKTMSPLNYNALFDGRTVLLHVMIVSVVFIHKFLFEGRSYAAAGEIVYVGLFMFFKAMAEIYRLNKSYKEMPEALPMI